jgi:hypothetical protein
LTNTYLQTNVAKTNLHKIEICCDEIATYFASFNSKRIIAVRWMSLYLWDQPLAGVVLRLNKSTTRKKDTLFEPRLKYHFGKKSFRWKHLIINDCRLEYKT